MTKSKSKSSAAAKRAKTARIKRRQSIRSQRPPHKAFFLHPITVFFWLCVGVLLTAITWQAAAANLAVTAKVSAPFLTDPAVIETMTVGSNTSDLIVSATDPSTAVVVKQSKVYINGTCPDVSYVSAYRNSALASVDICSNVHTFSLPIDLVPGMNTIKIQDYNLTDDPGPATPEVYIFYDNRLPPKPPTNSITPISNVTLPTLPSKELFLITSDYSYKTVLAGKPITWNISIVGGTRPYKLKIDFGDHTNTILNVSSSGKVTFSHTYRRANSKYGGYKIYIEASDSKGNNGFLQLIAVVKALPSSGGVTETTNNFGSFDWLPKIQNWLWFAWPAYLIVILMTISFWLGERQEVWLLDKHWFFYKKRRHKKTVQSH